MQTSGVERIQHADQGTARAQQAGFGLLRRAHLEHQVAAPGAGRVGDLGSHGGKAGIGDAGADAGA